MVAVVKALHNCAQLCNALNLKLCTTITAVASFPPPHSTLHAQIFFVARACSKRFYCKSSLIEQLKHNRMWIIAELSPKEECLIPSSMLNSTDLFVSVTRCDASESVNPQKLTLAISWTLCLSARSWDGTLAIHHNLIDVKSQPRTASYTTWNQNWSLHWTRETLQAGRSEEGNFW